MKSPRRQIQIFAAAIVFALTCGSIALADDSEVFLGAATSTVPPNIMLIIDTSGSMSTPVTSQTPYNPTQTYSGTCDPAGIYYQNVSNGNGNLPACTATAPISRAQDDCQSSVVALSIGAGTDPATNPGLYTDKVIRWRLKTSKYAWNTLTATNAYEIDCYTDYQHSLGPYPTTYNGAVNSAVNEFQAASAGSYWSVAANVTSANTYTLYTGNYLNWSATSTTTIGTRLSVVQSAATTLVNQMNGVNLGLMRYNAGAAPPSPSATKTVNGGYVVSPMVGVGTSGETSAQTTTNRQTLTTAISGLSANSYTPIAGTLYEAYEYFSGGSVYFGDHSTPAKSVASSRTGGVSTSHIYSSPIQYSCQKNYIVFLTDGLPTADNDADSLILGLPSESTLSTACDNTNVPPYSNLPGGWGPSQSAGMCAAALTQYMFNGDLSPLAGQQNVTTNFIGFGNDPQLAAAFGWLNTAATRGGGQAYTAGDLTSLQSVLTSITGSILQTSTTFTSPTVAVNAFNKTQTLSDLYIAMFQSGATYHWPGNLKKYSLANGVIVDANGLPAVDSSTGFITSSAQSIWSASPDGSNVPAGGAAHVIPHWDPNTTPSRNVYTYPYPGSPASPVTLTGANYQFTAANPVINPATPGGPLGQTTVAAQGALINYIRGEVLATGGDRFAMGDPLHSQPAIVIYGGSTSSPNVNDAVVFVNENDGMLHAFNVATGTELWSFIPYEVLPLLQNVRANPLEATKQYALDGSITVLKFDVNGDGVIDPTAGDRVLIFFGQGRGGSEYYALDVTNENAPQLVWSLGPTQLPAVSLAWSTPQLARVNIAGATQNAQQAVLIFGGGYDIAEENAAYSASDSTGNAIYMVDVLSGAVLWSAGKTVGNLLLPRMDHAIPSSITVVDTNNDGYADRMYVGDMAGQLWRFDIYNGQPVSSLVTGGVVASIGAHDEATPVVADTRRFYSPPDVAEFKRTDNNQPYFTVAIGSGYRGHPLDITADDRMYVWRDFSPLTAQPQSAYTTTQYNGSLISTDASFVDITALDTVTGLPTATLLPSSPGWKLLFNASGWDGEKSLSQATTFNNTLFFTTYTPAAATATTPCQPGEGTNKLYEVSPANGAPVNNLSAHNNKVASDRDLNLSQSGIATGVSIFFPGDTTTLANGTTVQNQKKLVCYVNLEAVPCNGAPTRQKTYWNGTDAQ